MKTKRWNRYTAEDQQKILSKYEVILTDHKTGREKLISALDTFSLQNVDKGIKKVTSGLDSFSKFMNEFDKSMQSNLGKNEKRPRII